MSNQSKKSTGFLDRENKESSLVPRLVFSVLRAVDPYLQYLLIFGGYGNQLISKTSLSTIPAGPKGLAIVAMAAGCAIKQIIHILYVWDAQITYGPAISICVYNTLTNSIGSLSTLLFPPSFELGPAQYVGISLFTVGVLTELISELQRKSFKDNPANKGKLYTGGLFSLARHINYGGYTLWRTGVALTSGNYYWTALQFFAHIFYFTKLAVPDLAGYCAKKYGDEWKKFERDTPNILLPYIW